MTHPPEPWDLNTLRDEAAAAWDIEARRGLLPPGPSLVLLAVVATVGAATLMAVGVRLARLFAGRPGPLAVVLAIDLGLAMWMLGGPVWAWLRAERRSREHVSRAQAEHPEADCPRCGTRSIPRGSAAASVRKCGACGALLLEALGLCVLHVSPARWRRLRWRAAAAARLGAPPAEPTLVWLSPPLWLAMAVLSLGVLWTTTAFVGGKVGLPARTMEAFAFVREVPHHGRAHAQTLTYAPLPAGPTTRPRAPSWVGTQVFARDGRGPYHQLAVIVRVERARAFVIYADGDSDWVESGDLLAPELAPGDRVEVFDGSGYGEALVLDRVGPAIRVQRSDGSEGWASASQVRVRSDAAHIRGAGLHSDVPPGAWVEARVEGAVWRPGLAVGADIARSWVTFSDGTGRWVSSRDVRPQRLGPGVRVWIDGWSESAVVAARIGHALAVVTDDGSRGWTALSRVRRP